MSPPEGPVPSPSIEGFLRAHVAEGHWPGAVYAIGRPGGPPAWTGAVGHLALQPEPEPIPAGALYDLASLTKPLATAAVTLRLAAAGAIDPDQPIDDVLPELSGYAGRTPSVTDLLLHRSGLPAWAPLYRRASEPDAVPAAIAAETPIAPAGERPVYSCLGPIAAVLVLERRTGSRFGDLFETHVREPLGLRTDDIGFSPVDPSQLPRVAPTERGRQREDEIAGPGPWGTDVVPGLAHIVRGEAHDGNACWLGGTAGNAGLFGTARAVFAIASAFAAPGIFLPGDVWERAAYPGIVHEDDARTLGFQAGLAPRAPAGAFGPASFGHVGFTGTSVWIDPRRPVVAVLLTNRVHPRWTDAPVQEWRRAFHGLAAALVEGSA